MGVTIKMTFKEYLKENSITVTGLSKLTNIPRSTISDIVNNTTNINSCHVSIFVSISRALNITMEDFYNLASNKYVYFRNRFKVILKDSNYILLYDNKEKYICKKDKITTKYIKDIANTDINNILRNERMKSWKTTISNS